MFLYFYILKFLQVKLAKYLHELLLENETVIYPGLGAFISNYKPAEIRENEIIPPSKVISFTQQFRNNDGMLVTFIARKAKISHMYAQKRIDRDRENMLYLLDKGEKVTIENIGVLFTGEKNEIQFTPFQDENSFLNSFGFESVKIEDSVAKSEDSLHIESIAEDVVDNAGIESVSEIKANPDFETSGQMIEPVNETITEATIESDNLIELNGEKEAEKIKFPQVKPLEIYEKHTERVKTGWYWLLLILFPVFFGGYFLISNYMDSNNSEINYPIVINEQFENNNRPDISTDSSLNPVIETIKTDSLIKPNSQQESLQENSKFYLVGGGFKSEENAEKYILRLQEKGMEGIMIGKRGNMFLVGIASFDSEEEAYNELNRRVRENPEWNLWVYQK